MLFSISPASNQDITLKDFMFASLAKKLVLVIILIKCNLPSGGITDLADKFVLV